MEAMHSVVSHDWKISAGYYSLYFSLYAVLKKSHQPQKDIRMLTDSTSDIVNIMQGSEITDSIPDMQQITPIIRELSLKDDVIALVIFGSVARGEARSISDIDLCIVTPRDLSQSSRWDLLSYGSEKIDVNLFCDLPITIRFRAIREGRVMFCKNTLLFHRIKAETVREYLDIAPLIRRHCLYAMGVKVVRDLNGKRYPV